MSVQSTPGSAPDFAPELELSPQALRERIAAHPTVILLDVRNAEDFGAAPRRIPGALKLDAEQADAWVAMLPPERQVIVYCQHGRRLSGLALNALLARGYRAARLSGGLDAWIEAGGDLTAE